MLKEKYLYVLLGVLFVLYVVVEYYAPKPIDWTETYSEKDVIPYGSYVLFDQLDEVFPDGKSVIFQTFYESIDSIDQQFVLAQNFEPSDQDIGVLLEAVEAGANVFVGARFFSERFLDTLGLELDFDVGVVDAVTRDSTVVAFSGNEEKFYYPSTMFRSTLRIMDTSSLIVQAKADNPIVATWTSGAGSIVVCTAPQIFTNYGLLHRDNYRFAEQLLTLLPKEDIAYNRYFHAGKPEAATPLRYALTQESLRWAVYLTVLLLLILLIFRSQRNQRAIPVLAGNENTTVQFVKTIGGLYHRQAHHYQAGERIIQHFLKELGAKYFVHTYDEGSYERISQKSGVPLEEVIRTFERIQWVQRSTGISGSDLRDLHRQIKKFGLND